MGRFSIKLVLERLIDIYCGIPLVYAVFFIQRIFSRIHSRSMPVSGAHRRVLFIKFWGVGNIAMLLPAVQAFRKRYPDADLDFLTLADNRNVALSTGLFAQIHIVDNNLVRLIPSLFKVLGGLRVRTYDLVVDFEQFARISVLMCFFCGAKASIGFNTRNQHRHFLYTVPVEYNNEIHMTRSFLSLVEHAGIPPVPKIEPVPFICSGQDRAAVKDILCAHQVGDDDILVLMQLGTSENFIERRWPPGHFAALADRIIGDARCRVIFPGLSAEKILIDECLSRMRQPQRAINAGGALSFGQYIALLRRVDLVVSADTAAVHLASAMSVAAVGLFGPNTPVLYGPWGMQGHSIYKGIPCSPCITNYNAKLNRCRHPQGRGACMKKISVDEVWGVIEEEFLAKKEWRDGRKRHD